MEMNRRHFQVIADIIRELPLELETKKVVSGVFADRLSFTNGLFKRERFLSRCGVTPIGEKQ